MVSEQPEAKTLVIPSELVIEKGRGILYMKGGKLSRKTVSRINNYLERTARGKDSYPALQKDTEDAR